jgi:hypothetical protein
MLEAYMPREREFDESNLHIAWIIIAGIFVLAGSYLNWIPPFLAWAAVFVTFGIVAVLRSRAIRCKRLATEKKTGVQVTPTENEHLADVPIATAAGTGLFAYFVALVIILAVISVMFIVLAIIG